MTDYLSTPNHQPNMDPLSMLKAREENYGGGIIVHEQSEKRTEMLVKFIAKNPPKPDQAKIGEQNMSSVVVTTDRLLPEWREYACKLLKAEEFHVLTAEDGVTPEQLAKKKLVLVTYEMLLAVLPRLLGISLPFRVIYEATVSNEHVENAILQLHRFYNWSVTVPYISDKVEMCDDEKKDYQAREEVLFFDKKIVKLVRLRQAAIHPSLINGKLNEMFRTAKIRKLLEKLNEILNKDQTVVIVSEFVSALNLVEKHLKVEFQDRVTIKKLYGLSLTKQSERNEAVRKLNAQQANVLLLSGKTEEKEQKIVADHLIFLEPNWTKGYDDRNLSRFQTPPSVHRLFTKNTVEEEVLSKFGNLSIH